MFEAPVDAGSTRWEILLEAKCHGQDTPVACEVNSPISARRTAADDEAQLRKNPVAI